MFPKFELESFCVSQSSEIVSVLFFCLPFARSQLMDGEKEHAKLFFGRTMALSVFFVQDSCHSFRYPILVCVWSKVALGGGLQPFSSRPRCPCTGHDSPMHLQRSSCAQLGMMEFLELKRIFMIVRYFMNTTLRKTK